MQTRQQLLSNIKTKMPIIETIVDFWIECINQSDIANIPKPDKIKLAIFRRSLILQILKDEYSIIELLKCGRMMEIDYDIPKVFDDPLLYSGINRQLLPSKTWVMLDEKNMLETDEVLSFYIRASSGYRAEQYYLTPKEYVER